MGVLVKVDASDRDVRISEAFGIWDRIGIEGMFKKG
jgi:hypothetical protein